MTACISSNRYRTTPSEGLNYQRSAYFRYSVLKYIYIYIQRLDAVMMLWLLWCVEGVSLLHTDRQTLQFIVESALYQRWLHPVGYWLYPLETFVCTTKHSRGFSDLEGVCLVFQYFPQGLAFKSRHTLSFIFRLEGFVHEYTLERVSGCVCVTKLSRRYSDCQLKGNTFQTHVTLWRVRHCFLSGGIHTWLYPPEGVRSCLCVSKNFAGVRISVWNAQLT